MHRSSHVHGWCAAIDPTRGLIQGWDQRVLIKLTPSGSMLVSASCTWWFEIKACQSDHSATKRWTLLRIQMGDGDLPELVGKPT